MLSRHASQVKLTLVKHALLGAQHAFPGLKGKLSTAWEHVRVWEEQRIVRLRQPLPIPIWLCMVGLARAHAKVEADTVSRYDWEVFSVLLEIGLFCMLRPGELMRIHHSDVSLPGSFIMCERHAAIRIVSPKNRRQFGENQFVLVKHENCIAWLAKIVRDGENQPLWQGGARLFSHFF